MIKIKQEMMSSTESASSDLNNIKPTARKGKKGRAAVNKSTASKENLSNQKKSKSEKVTKPKTLKNKIETPDTDPMQINSQQSLLPAQFIQQGVQQQLPGQLHFPFFTQNMTPMQLPPYSFQLPMGSFQFGNNPMQHGGHSYAPQ